MIRLLVLIGIISVIPIYKAFTASKQAEKFKILVFVITFYEWVGWILCITIVGIPIGLGLVLISQYIRLTIEIENNTRKTNELLEKQI